MVVVKGPNGGFHSTKEVSKGYCGYKLPRLEECFHSTKEVSKEIPLSAVLDLAPGFHSTKEVSKGRFAVVPHGTKYSFPFH